MNKEVIKRIDKELDELQEKIKKLLEFKKTDTFKNLNAISSDLLDTQLSVMLAYRDILTIRLAFLMAEDE